MKRIATTLLVSGIVGVAQTQSQLQVCDSALCHGCKTFA